MTISRRVCWRLIATTLAALSVVSIFIVLKFRFSANSSRLDPSEIESGANEQSFDESIRLIERFAPGKFDRILVLDGPALAESEGSDSPRYPRPPRNDNIGSFLSRSNVVISMIAFNDPARTRSVDLSGVIVQKYSREISWDLGEVEKTKEIEKIEIEGALCFRETKTSGGASWRCIFDKYTLITAQNIDLLKSSVLGEGREFAGEFLSAMRPLLPSPAINHTWTMMRSYTPEMKDIFYSPLDYRSFPELQSNQASIRAMVAWGVKGNERLIAIRADVVDRSLASRYFGQLSEKTFGIPCKIAFEDKPIGQFANVDIEVPDVEGIPLYTVGLLALFGIDVRF